MLLGVEMSLKISRPGIKNVLATPAESLDLDVPETLLTDSPSYSFDPRFYFPNFQPIIDIPSGLICGYESLVRTYSQGGGIVSAGWLFEDDHISDDIRINIDRSVREKSLIRFAKDPACGLLFINISPQWASMLQAGREAPTLKMIREIGIDPARVVIEITEKVANPELLETMVNVYRSAGLKIAIDDFGVGGSQIDRLIAINPDYIKIDMGIFKDASKNGDSAKVLLALSTLSQHADFEIICEGVETEEEFHFAIECGAQKVQGWLFGQADALLHKPDITRDSVAFLQALYLERKKERVARAAERNSLIAKYVNLIYDYHRLGRVSDLDASLLNKAGLIRYFLCDLAGKQITPNIDFCKEGMVVDDASVGCYWSHRPYFALALGLKNKEDQRVVSTPYVDTVTKKLCKTTALFFDADTIMLVDSISLNDVLYCD